MNFEQRNDFGYPVADRLEIAKKYAAGTSARTADNNCQCSLHKQAALNEQLAAVQRILAARK